MKPLIGITSELRPDHVEGRGLQSTSLLTTYPEGVAAAGGTPVVLPLAREEFVRDILSRLDGLILSGGRDIPADVLGEEPHPSLDPMLPDRWHSERLWLETALEMGKPVLGICLGMQIMNVVAGGRIIQDIPSQKPGGIDHARGGHRRNYHEVLMVEGTKLAELAPAARLETTSAHHQAIAGVPDGYRLAATGPDGIIEAIERPDRPFVIGVQWHPERGPESPDWLLQAFVRHC